MNFQKAVPLRAGSSRLNPRQLILALKEQRGGLFSNGAGWPAQRGPHGTRGCPTPTLVRDFHVEAPGGPPRAWARCGGRGTRAVGRGALGFQGRMTTPHRFLEFKSASFRINIFFNRIFLLFLKDIKTAPPISSNTRLYILTRFSQAFFGYL